MADVDEIFDLYEEDYDQDLLKERVEMASDKVLSDLFYYLSEADNGLPQILKTNYKLCNELLIIIMKKQLANFQIDPALEDLEVKADFQINPAWEDFGRLEEADFQIDPAWEDFGRLTDEQRIEEQRLEEQRIEEQRLDEQRFEEQPLEWKSKFYEKKRLQDDVPFDISQIANIFVADDISMYNRTVVRSYRTPILDNVGRMVMAEIKKVFVNETIIFVDYTYSQNLYDQNYGLIGAGRTLNYLNLITNKGHIYSVQFHVTEYLYSGCSPNSKYLKYFSFPVCNRDHQGICSCQSTYDPKYKITLVKYDETFNPTKTNLTMLKWYTSVNNGTKQETDHQSYLRRGQGSEFFLEKKIVTVLSYLEK